MKKILFMLIALVAAISANAEQAIVESKFYDNVSITLKGGVTTPLQNPVDYPRGMFGIEFEKMITPVFGLGVEGEWTIDTSTWPNQIPSSHAIDHQYVGVYGATNMMNLLAGYKGEPRAFEIETVLGVGWGHSYDSWQGGDENVVVTKVGLNLNYNFGDEKEWTVSLKPAVVWNMSQVPSEGLTLANYNINRGALQVQAGFTYHFKGSNDSRHFLICDKKYTQRDIDNLNNSINTLREQNAKDKETANNQINQLLKTNQYLTDALKKCQETKVESAEIVNRQVFSPIQFKQGSAMLVNSDAALKSIAEAMIADGGTYTVYGYASEEGSEEWNKELSMNRACVVADELVFWGVDVNKIVVEGKGRTNQFGSANLNRVVVISKK